jgi:hypothetical protein
MANPWKFDSELKLAAAGYQFIDTSKCLSPNCNTTVHWFLTPKGKYMPMEVIPREPGDDEAVTQYQPHFASCVDARKFSQRESGVVDRK